MRLRLQSDYLHPHNHNVLRGFGADSVDFASDWIRVVDSVPDPGDPEHGPEDGGPLEDGDGSFHHGSAATLGADVQVLLLSLDLIDDLYDYEL